MTFSHKNYDLTLVGFGFLGFTVKDFIGDRTILYLTERKQIIN